MLGGPEKLVIAKISDRIGSVKYAKDKSIERNRNIHYVPTCCIAHSPKTYLNFIELTHNESISSGGKVKKKRKQNLKFHSKSNSFEIASSVLLRKPGFPALGQRHNKRAHKQRLIKYKSNRFLQRPIHFKHTHQAGR